MEKVFFAQSSNGLKAYKVEFQFDVNQLTVYCDCPAGVLGKLCKHKLGFLRGDKDFLRNQEQQDILDVQEWIKQSDYPQLLRELEISELELEKLRAKIISIKMNIERSMKSAK